MSKYCPICVGFPFTYILNLLFVFQNDPQFTVAVYSIMAKVFYPRIEATISISQQYSWLHILWTTTWKWLLSSVQSVPWMKNRFIPSDFADTNSYVSIVNPKLVQTLNNEVDHLVSRSKFQWLNDLMPSKGWIIDNKNLESSDVEKLRELVIDLKCIYGLCTSDIPLKWRALLIRLFQYVFMYLI